MLADPVGGKLIAREQELRSQRAEAEKKVNAAEEKYSSAKTDTDKGQISIEVAKAKQSRSDITAQLNKAIIDIEHEATNKYHADLSETPAGASANIGLAPPVAAGKQNSDGNK